jgi:glycosyltransferase involved in cell wall biosynthesis
MFIPRPEPSFSIVIPTFGRPRGLARLLNSLAPQIAGRMGREVIVVNDGSDESAYDAIINRHRGWVTYIRSDRNRGPSAARNLGARSASGDFLVFIDDDCAAPFEWLDQLIRLLHIDATLDAVGGTTRPLESAHPRWFEKLLIEGGCHPNPVFYDGKLIVMVSACLAVRRLTFETLGGFVEKVTPLAEDRNLTTRLRVSGARCLIKPEWFVYHDMASTPKQHFRRYFNYGRGVKKAIALEDVPLDRPYWPPARRPLSYWLSRARARLRETRALAPKKHTALERLPLVALAAATNLTMDIGFTYAEREPLTRRNVPAQ